MITVFNKYLKLLYPMSLNYPFKLSFLKKFYRWLSDPLDVNAYYGRGGNAIGKFH